MISICDVDVMKTISVSTDNNTNICIASLLTFLSLCIQTCNFNFCLKLSSSGSGSGSGSGSSRNEYYLGGIIALLQDHRTVSTKSVCSSQYMVTDQH